MKQLIIKIGGNFKQEIRAAFEKPDPALFGTMTIYVKNFEELREILTPQRLALLDELSKREDQKEANVSNIAHKLKRKQEAVSRDLSILEKNGLIKKTKQKQAVHPKLAFSKIEIQLAKARA